VGGIAERLVEEHLHQDRFEDLRRIGVDEISYRKHHKYLTVVMNHDREQVISVGVGKSSETLAKFFEALGPERARLLEVASIDMSAGYEKAIREYAPQAEIVFDGILAFVESGLTNARLEGVNNKIRLLSHRAFGFHSPHPLIATIYLCCSAIELPELQVIGETLVGDGLGLFEEAPDDGLALVGFQDLAGREGEIVGERGVDAVALEIMPSRPATGSATAAW
jgi:hypothetical protein